MSWWELFASELAITVTNPDVWRSIGLALVLGAACWMFGTWVARTVGLLGPGAAAGETLGVGLASGLMVVAAWWAAIWSGGRSSFTPVAVGFAIAIVLGVVARRRRRADPDAGSARSATGDDDRRGATWLARRPSLVLTAVAAGLFVVVIALVYGSTMAPSPRDGVQPVEFVDEAFYSVLGRDLATTGTENNLSASGFDVLPDLPVQAWYHWGELWLASAVIAIFGTAPLSARYFMVLPVALLAVAALTGTLVRHMTRTNSRGAYVFGVLCCVLLAPLPVLPGPFFSSWAVGMIFGIRVYGLGAVAALLALYIVLVLARRRATWGLAGYVGSAVAFIVPAHVAIAALALVGVAGTWAIRIIQSVMAMRRLPHVPQVWARALIATALAILATLAWGQFTGHSMGGGGSPPVVSPFNASWRESVAITVLGAGAFVAIPVAWFLERRRDLLRSDIYLGTMGLLLAGAIGWGARLGEFTMFYLFFGGIAVFATAVAAAAAWRVLGFLLARQRTKLAAGLMVLCGGQLVVAGVAGIVRMQLFGPHEYVPTPETILAAIRELSPEAKLAYACHPLEEVAFATPRLLSIDAHTGRRVVPMCFQAETLSQLIGAEPAQNVENLVFIVAPQRQLYRDPITRPPSTAVSAFLKGHGIDYIYADERHPNSLVDDAVLVASDGGTALLRIP